ncbi:hypothetical protein ACRRTK_012023 [Alexandromys fortis]
MWTVAETQVRTETWLSANPSVRPRKPLSPQDLHGQSVCELKVHLAHHCKATVDFSNYLLSLYVPDRPTWFFVPIVLWLLGK